MEPTTLPNTSANQIIKTAIPTALIGAALGASASGDIPAWLQKMAEQWGPGFVIMLGFFLAVIYYIPRDTIHTAIRDFTAAQRDQAVALSSISQSLHDIGGQRGKLDEILEKQDQIILNLSVGTERFKRLEEKLLYDAEHHPQ